MNVQRILVSACALGVVGVLSLGSIADGQEIGASPLPSSYGGNTLTDPRLALSNPWATRPLASDSMVHPPQRQFFAPLVPYRNLLHNDVPTRTWGAKSPFLTIPTVDKVAPLGSSVIDRTAAADFDAAMQDVLKRSTQPTAKLLDAIRGYFEAKPSYDRRRIDECLAEQRAAMDSAKRMLGALNVPTIAKADECAAEFRRFFSTDEGVADAIIRETVKLIAEVENVYNPSADRGDAGRRLSAFAQDLMQRVAKPNTARYSAVRNQFLATHGISTKS